MNITFKEYCFRWKVLLGIVSSIVLLNCFNRFTMDTHYLSITDMQMYILIIPNAILFWSVFLYLNFNWGSSRIMRRYHINEATDGFVLCKKDLGLLVAVFCGFLYILMLRIGFSEGFSIMPRPGVRSARTASPSPSTMETIYWYIRYVMVFCFVSRLLKLHIDIKGRFYDVL